MLKPARRTLLVFPLSFVLGACASAQPLPKVPVTDLSKLKPSDFKDDELDMPYYLANFHRVANAIVEEGENRGFIDIAVWRSKNDNKTYNARIMENCVTLAFFYCTDRPWNIYYKHPALRARLEAALQRWCNMQTPDGKFTEYSPTDWNLAATAFSTKFMGETLRLLKDGPPIDAELHRQVIAAQRKSIMCVLTDEEMWRLGKSYSNQYTNVWGGALAYLKLYPEREMEQQLKKRIGESVTALQSPAGYFYEKDGPDWGYNLGTHHSNLHVAWHYARGTDLERSFVDEKRRWCDWLSYNAVLEPDGSGFVLNRAVETRTGKTFLDPLDADAHNLAYVPLAEKVELARPFEPSAEERANRLTAKRKTLEKDWPRVKEFKESFMAFPPYAFLHRNMVRWDASVEQKKAATSKLPYLARERFIHQRADDRKAVAYTFVRHPSYYAAFNSGELVTPRQRFGLGLIWNLKAGTWLQSQSDSSTAAWGTKVVEAENVYEAATTSATFTIGGKPSAVEPGARDLPEGILAISYVLGKQGKKTVRFEANSITVDVEHAGAFAEYIPLLKGATDRIEVTDNRLSFRRGESEMVIAFDRLSGKPMLTETETAVGGKRVVIVSANAANQLSYSFSFR
jgi:hypothetical protein